MKYFDIHSHLNFSDYKEDFKDVIQRLKDTETHTIVVGTDYESSEKAVELADKYEEIYACIGIHPTGDVPFLKLTSGSVFDYEKFDRLAKHPKVVAVGECGFDFFHKDKNLDYERQMCLFVDQIEFAIKHSKPLMIHVRPSPESNDAYEEVLDVLEHQKKKYGKALRGNIHFFAGSVEIAERFLSLGFTLSFTGVITFTKDYDDVIKHVALETIMAETDAPYVAPVPYRGKRNEPSYVSEVVKRIAEIRGEDFEEVRQTLVNNAQRMIG